jgi:hypothetical protein
MKSSSVILGNTYSTTRPGSDNVCEFLDQTSIIEINKVLYSQKPVTNHIWSLKAEKMKLEGVKDRLLAKKQARVDKESGLA